MARTGRGPRLCPQCPSGAGAASGLFDVATGNQIDLYKVHDTIVGRVGSGPATADPAGTAAFVVSVDANGLVTLDQVRALTSYPKYGEQ